MARQLTVWSRRSQIWRTYRVAWLLLRTLYIINRERVRVVRARARGEYDARPNVDALVGILREFRRTAVDLGGLMIKLGQFLGARADLLPPEALAELAALHDEVPPECFHDIKRLIEHELGAPIGRIFANVDPNPAGSASLGQVHRAQLLDGRTVAIKVQRPGIRQIVRTDLNALHFVLEVVRRIAPMFDRMIDLRGLYREFSRTVYEELDYRREGENAERFARLFADEHIGAPGVLWSHTTRRVLALEWVTGIRITHVAELKAAGLDPHALAKQLAGTYFKQVLEAGYFHADPHPGNIFVQPVRDGAPRMIFVDFGMMGAITPRMKAGLRACFGGFVRQDPALVVQGLDTLGFLSDLVDHDVIEQVVGVMLTRFSALPFGRIRDVNPHEVMSEVETVLYDQPLRLPSQLAFFGRAVSMLVGLTTLLSPEFNFIEVAKPFAKDFVGRGGIAGLLELVGVESVDALGRDLLREGISLARTLATLPQHVERVLARAERGDLRLIVESPDLNPPQGLRIRRRFAVRMLNRPVPAWIPLSMVAAIVVSLLSRRRQR